MRISEIQREAKENFDRNYSRPHVIQHIKHMLERKMVMQGKNDKLYKLKSNVFPIGKKQAANTTTVHKTMRKAAYTASKPKNLLKELESRISQLEKAAGKKR